MNKLVEPLRNYKRAVELWPEASTLNEYHNAILYAIEGNNHGVVEHVKSFIECLCVTILTEVDRPLPSLTPMLTELLVEALRALGLQNTRGASKLDKVLSAFNKLSDAISEMRNENGPVVHGKDGFLDSLYLDHSRTFLHTGDAIVGVLINALKGTEPNLLSTREPYERFSHLTKKIDGVVSLRSLVESDEDGYMLNVTLTVAGKPEEEIKLRVEPSRLLYSLDRDIFVEVLNEALSIVDIVDIADKAEREDEAITESIESGTIKQQSITKKVKSLAKYQEELIKYLHSECISVDKQTELVKALLDVGELFMVVDWQVRDSQKAFLKLRFRKIFQKFGIDRDGAEEISERLISWFIIQIPVEQ